MIEIYKPGKPLRSGSQCMLVVPKIRKKKLGVWRYCGVICTVLIWKGWRRSLLSEWIENSTFTRSSFLFVFLCTVCVSYYIMLLTFRSSHFNICASLRFKTCIYNYWSILLSCFKDKALYKYLYYYYQWWSWRNVSWLMIDCGSWTCMEFFHQNPYVFN